MAKLESLIVDLQVNTAELKKGLDEANAKVEKFGKKLDDLAKVITFDKIAHLAKEAAVALGEFALKGAETADHMGKLAQSAGVSVESFSKLAYGFRLSDVSADELGGAMNKLNKNIAEAAAGSGHQAALFRALGVAITDSGGKVRGTDAVMKDLADRFASMEDGANKALLSGELFGKQLGSKMIPALNQGAEGLAKMADESDRLGATISGKAARSAEEFNDNITRIHAAVDGVAVRVAAQLTPALTKLTDQFLNSKETAGALKDVVDVLATALKLLASAGVIVSGVFDFVGTALGGVGAQIALILQGEFKKAADVGNDLDRELVASAKRTVSRVGAIWDTNTAAEENAKKTEKVVTRSGQATVAAFKAGEEAAKNFKTAMAALDKVIAGYEEKIGSFDLGPIEQIEEKFKHGELAENLKKVGASAAEVEEKIRSLASQLHNLEMGKLSIEVDANIASTRKAAGRDVHARDAAMGMVGMGERDKLGVQSAGFASFDAALKALADQTVRQAKKLGEAALLRKDGDIEGARRAEEAAAQAGRLAEQAGAAADAMTELAQMDFDETNAQVAAFGAGLAAVGTQFASKLGDLGDVIQAGIQGAESGGIWGAIIAVVIELLSKFERFSEILNIATGAVQLALKDMGGGLSDLVDGIRPLMGAISGIAEAVHDILGPILSLVGKLFKQIAGTLMPLGTIMQMIGSSLAPLFTILGGIMDILKIFQPILALVSIAMLGLKLGIDYVNLGFQMFIDWILEKLGSNNNSGVEAAEKQIAEDLKKIETMAKNLEKDPFNAATGAAEDVATDLEDMGKAADKSGKALDKLTGSLTNVPAGFRYNLAKYNATSPIDWAGKPASGSMGMMQVNISGGVMMTVAQLTDAVLHAAERRKWQKSGAPP
jgi:hypothetical protein